MLTQTETNLLNEFSDDIQNVLVALLDAREKIDELERYIHDLERQILELENKDV